MGGHTLQVVQAGDALCRQRCGAVRACGELPRCNRRRAAARCGDPQMMRLAAAFLAFFVVTTPAWPAPKFPALPNFPKLSGRVVDDANILSSDTKAGLTEKLA